MNTSKIVQKNTNERDTVQGDVLSPVMLKVILKQTVTRISHITTRNMAIP